ncbi:MAG TPA: hypothetical protein VJ036_05885 [bacterium]|jgi:hypothetical protein|nr:hypothetical protein [bacterium]
MEFGKGKGHSGMIFPDYRQEGTASLFPELVYMTGTGHIHTKCSFMVLGFPASFPTGD